MASRKGRFIVWGAQCRHARTTTKNWPYSSRSHKLFLIHQHTHCPCKMSTRQTLLISWTLVQLTSPQRKLLLLPGQLAATRLLLTLSSSSGAPNSNSWSRYSSTSFWTVLALQGICAWEQYKEHAGCSIPVCLTLFLFSLSIQRKNNHTLNDRV